MAGGLIEGFQKVFKGKNLIQKHLFLFLLSIALLSINILKNSHTLTMGLLIPISLVSNIILYLYILHFTHNAVKFCVYSDREENIEKVKAIQIMPEVNLNIFSHFWSWLGFIIIWWLIFFSLGLVIGFLASLPILGLLFVFIAYIFSFIIVFSYPIIITKFAETYSVKHNLSVANLFLYFPKVFVPVFLLYLKVLLILVPIFFILKIIYTMCDNFLILFIIKLITLYILIITWLAISYEYANIYYNKIKIEEEI